MRTIPKLDKQGIPAKVLQGKVPRYLKVARLYRARLHEEIMRQLNESFWIRSDYGSTDVAARWKKLAPNTPPIKEEYLAVSSRLILNGKSTRGLLAPEQRKRFDDVKKQIYASLRANGVPSTKAKAQAEKQAWARVREMSARIFIDAGRETNINIRTGRLVNSTSPGTVSNSRYYPPKDQKVSINSRYIKMKLVVPYAKDVQEVRPIIPKDISPWIITAHGRVIAEVKALYVSLQPSSNDSSKSRKTKQTTRTKTRRNNNPSRGKRTGNRR